MADFPEESSFLTSDEKAAVIARLKEDQGAAGEAKFSKVHFFNALKDWRVYTYMLIYIGALLHPVAAISADIPAIQALLSRFTHSLCELKLSALIPTKLTSPPTASSPPSSPTLEPSLVLKLCYSVLPPTSLPSSSLCKFAERAHRAPS